MPLRRNKAESRRREHRIRTRERLRSRTNRLQNLAAAQTLILLQVLKEVHQIPAKASHLTTSNKRVHRHSAIRATVHIPLRTSNRGRSNGRASRGDRARATKRRKPDHDFVLGGARGGRRCEHVVGDVGDNGRAGVRPLPGCGQRREFGERLLGGGGHDVGEGLDAGGSVVRQSMC